MDFLSDYERRGSGHLRNHKAAAAANSTHARFEQPSSSFPNRNVKRKEKSEKIPYFIDAARESDRLRSHRRREVESRNYEQRRQISMEISEGFKVKERHKARSRHHYRFKDKQRRSRSRSQSYNKHRTLHRSQSQEISEPIPERVPVYIPIPVPTSSYPFGCTWPTLSRRILQPQHLLPVYSPLAQFGMHLRPQPPNEPYYGQRSSFRYNTRFHYYNRAPPQQQYK